jgi:hypothetical protein
MKTKINIIIQGRPITDKILKQIRSLILTNASWNRTRLSRELCLQWDWTNAQGELKDMACRTLLLKLESKKLIQLPPRQSTVHNENRNRNIQPVPHSRHPIQTSLKKLLPLQISLVDNDNDEQRRLFGYLLYKYHYLSYHTPVGENIKYLIKDKNGRVLSCMLFGSAAWRVAGRDQFIGWSENHRKAHLHLVTNNSRFLILDWVNVPNLASYLLSVIAKRISKDFQDKYAHPVYLLETFVERQRFKGTCYKAANWIHVGQTQGRSRNDRYSRLSVPVKNIFLYPLTQQFQEHLNGKDFIGNGH